MLICHVFNLLVVFNQNWKANYKISLGHVNQLKPLWPSLVLDQQSPTGAANGAFRLSLVDVIPFESSTFYMF